MSITRIVFTSILFSGLAIGSSVMAQQAKKPSGWGATTAKKTTNDKKEVAKPSPVPWLVNCASTGVAVNCVTSQKLFLQKTKQLLLGITVRRPPKAKTGVMMIQLPHGMHLPDGVQIKIDEQKPATHPVQTCNQQGCYVGLPIEAGLLKQMKSGKIMSISFKNLNKKDVKIGVPLKGFDQAYNKLQS